MKLFFVPVLMLAFAAPTVAQSVKPKPLTSTRQKAAWDEIGTLEHIRVDLIMQRRQILASGHATQSDLRLNRQTRTMIERKLREAKQRKAREIP